MIIGLQNGRAVALSPDFLCEYLSIYNFGFCKLEILTLHTDIAIFFTKS